MIILVEKVRDKEYYKKQVEALKEIPEQEEEEDEREIEANSKKVLPDCFSKVDNRLQLAYQDQDDNIYHRQIDSLIFFYDRTRENKILFDKEELEKFIKFVSLQ